MGGRTEEPGVTKQLVSKVRTLGKQLKLKLRLIDVMFRIDNR